MAHATGGNAALPRPFWPGRFHRLVAGGGKQRPERCSGQLGWLQSGSRDLRRAHRAVTVAERLRRRVPPVLLKPVEAAEALGMSLRHFDRHVKPDLPVVYSGGLRLYPVSALQAWADEQAIRPGRRAA